MSASPSFEEVQYLLKRISLRFPPLDKLFRRQAEVREHLTQHHDCVACHLPAEIVSHIFAIYTENFNSDFNPEYPTFKHSGPLLLGAVSKSWREVAFSTPHLWNTVNILIPSINKLPTKFELIKQWLNRSRQLPLYLSLFPGSRSTRRVKPLIPLFSLLQNVASRWYKIVLGIHPKLYAAFLGNLTSALALNSLKFTHGWYSRGTFFLPNTPSLKHLDIQSDILLSNLSIAWGNLTTIEVNTITVDEFFEVLRLAGGLESFTLLDLSEDMGNYQVPITPLTHSALRELHLNNDDSESDQLEILLDLAVFPSLEKFGFSFCPNQALQSLFSRSHCQLTHFEFFAHRTSDYLIFILSDLPTITHLVLEDSYFIDPDDVVMSDEFLLRLTPTLRNEDTHTGRLLPHLESLEFVGYKAFSWNSLAGLVGATTSGGPNLSTISERQGQGSVNSIRHISFRVYFRGEREFIDAHSLAHFKGARDAGVSIVIMNEASPLCNPRLSSFDATGDQVYPFDLFPEPTIDR